jgi:hypothetical protein
VPWILLLGPGLSDEVEVADVVKPRIVKILTANDYQTITCYGGEMSVTRAGYELWVGDVDRRWQPSPCGEVEKVNVV